MIIAIDGRLINKTQNTGISRYTEFLIEYYCTNYSSDKILLIVNDNTLDYSGATLVHCKYKPFDIRHFCVFHKFVESLKLDFLHSPFYSGLFKKVNKTKCIVTIHDLMYKLVPGFFGKNNLTSKLKIAYFDIIVGISMKNADKLISVSETTKIDVKRIFNLDSFHIPEDSEIFGSEDHNILKRLRLEDKKFYFYCGNNRPHKNISFICNVFNRNPDLPMLLLAGNGHSSSVNVKAVGIVTDNELITLYKHCKAFIFPSTYEGFGLPILESLRCKSLVIASNISAFLEFKSVNISFFKQYDELDFLAKLADTDEISYAEEPEFFEFYSKQKIFNLLDQVVNPLLTFNR